MMLLITDAVVCLTAAKRQHRTECEERWTGGTGTDSDSFEFQKEFIRLRLCHNSQRPEEYDPIQCCYLFSVHKVARDSCFCAYGFCYIRVMTPELVTELFSKVQKFSFPRKVTGVLLTPTELQPRIVEMAVVKFCLIKYWSDLSVTS